MVQLTLKEKLKLKKEEQEKAKTKVETKKEALSHPPIAPKPEKAIKKLKPPPKAIIKKPPTRAIPEIESLEEEFFIDFNKIASNSSFQRFIVEAIKMSVPQLKGVSARLSKEGVNKAFNQKIKEIDKAVVIYNELKGMDTKMLKEIRTNPLFLAQQKLNNPKT